MTCLSTLTTSSYVSDTQRPPPAMPWPIGLFSLLIFQTQPSVTNFNSTILLCFSFTRLAVVAWIVWSEYIKSGMANEFKVKLASSCSRCSLSGWWGESPPSVEGNRLSDGWEDCAEKEAWASFTYTPTKKEENIVKEQSQLLPRKYALRVIVADGLEDGERASWVTGGQKVGGEPLVRRDHDKGSVWLFVNFP